MIDKIRNFLDKITWAHVGLAVAVFFAFFYFTYDTSQIQSREEALIAGTQNLATLEKRLEEAKVFEREFEQKKKHYADLVKELQAMQGALPRQFFLPDLLSDILRESKQLEVEINSITPDAKESTSEFYSSLGFSIEATGTFHQFFILMDRLAAMKRLVGINSMRMVRDPGRESITLGGDEGAFAETKMSGGRSAFPGIRATIRVLTYRYKAPTANATGG